VKLPSLQALGDDPYFKSLYQHDLQEWHCDEPTGRSFYYKERMREIIQLLTAHIPRGGWVLDLACSQANLALLMAEKGYRVIAADLRKEPLCYARLKYERGTFYSVQCSAEKLPFQGPLDGIIAGEVVEHMAYPEHLIQECRRVLKPDGILCLTTPNGVFFRSRLPTYHQVGDRAQFVSEQFQPDEDGHLFLFTEKALCELLRAHGFEILQVRYLRTIFYGSARLFHAIRTLLGFGVVQFLEHAVSRFHGPNRFLSEALMVAAKPAPLKKEI